MAALLWMQAFSFTGEVQTPHGDPLPYTIIRVPQTGFQTVSGADGRFSLTVYTDTLVIELRHLGYRVRRDTLYRSEAKARYTFMLLPQEVRLGGVIITEGGQDPAELLIRKAIAARSRNRTCLPAFRAETYTLFTIRSPEASNPAIRKLLRLTDRSGGVVFLSESFSHVFFTPPDRYREEIHHSRIVGSQRYSFLGGWVFRGFDPYADRLSLEELTETPFILPLASDAPLYYRYELLGSYWDDEQLFYKIQIKPRSYSSPCVEGYIILADETYALIGLEWRVQAPRPIRYTDSIGVRATYLPVGGCYVLGEVSFRGRFRVSLPVGGEVSFVGEGYGAYRKYDYLAFTSRRQVRPSQKLSSALPPSSISAGQRESKIETLRVEKLDFGELVWIAPNAAKSSGRFWDSLRLAPLDSLQVQYITAHDSLIAMRDTIRESGGRWVWRREGIGWRYRFPHKKLPSALSVLIPTIGYTPPEGWFMPLLLRLEVGNFTSALNLRYGFGWGKILPVGEMAIDTRHYPKWSGGLRGGLEMREPSDFVQISPLWNALYKLAEEETPWQGYVRPFISAYLSRYFHRTLEVRIQTTWDERKESYASERAYPAWRPALWLTWQPGTRLFSTPRTTLFLPPESPFTGKARAGVELTLAPIGIWITFSGGISAELSVSPLGRLQADIIGAWQTSDPPWADRLYLSSTPLIFHRGVGDFIFRNPYEPAGRWVSYGTLAWLPEGSILRLIPLLRRPGWKEAFTLRAAYSPYRGWHGESSIFLYDLHLRWKRTALTRPLSLGIHFPLKAGDRQIAFTMALGSPLVSLPLPKPTFP